MTLTTPPGEHHPPINFTALDFETANHDRASICAVGLVRVENGRIVREKEILVQPPGNHYLPFFTAIHGISAGITRDTPGFGALWRELAPWIHDQRVVAHNGFRFDFPCLRRTLDFYEIEPPEFVPMDTYQLFGRGLASLCQQHNIDLKHHNALSDARACARLYLLWAEEKEARPRT